jgi:CheY-like chemotaxis protein
VRNSDDGFESAKLLAGTGAPRMAILSNTLARLRGLDVCRFLSATGRKKGVYVVLVCDEIDLEIVDLCHRAGVDDVVSRPLVEAAFTSRLEVAAKVIELEDELARVQGILSGLAAFESPADKRAKALREANAALLGVQGRKEAEEKKPAEPARTAQPPPQRPPAADIRPRERTYRGVQFNIKDEAPSPPPTTASGLPAEAHSLFGPPPPTPAPPPPRASAPGKAAPPQPAPAPAGEAPMFDVEAVIAQGAANSASNGGHTENRALENAQIVQQEELADEELIHPFEFDDIILNVFSGMGVTLKSEIPPKELPEGNVFAAWVGVAIPSAPVWLDVLLTAGEACAKAVTKDLLGLSKVQDSDVNEMFAELQNMVQGALRRYLEGNGHKPVIQLAIPRAGSRDEAIHLPESEPLVQSGFSFGGEALNAYLFEHREHSTSDSVADLHCYDLICDAVMKLDSPGELFVAGSIVRAKEKAVAEGYASKVKPFRVMRVSPLAKAIGPARLLETGGTPCCDH